MSHFRTSRMRKLGFRDKTVSQYQSSLRTCSAPWKCVKGRRVHSMYVAQTYLYDIRVTRWILSWISTGDSRHKVQSISSAPQVNANAQYVSGTSHIFHPLSQCRWISIFHYCARTVGGAFEGNSPGMSCGMRDESGQHWNSFEMHRRRRARHRYKSKTYNFY